MNLKDHSLRLVAMITLAVALSACTQSVSTAPANTPTVIATGLFVSPYPSTGNPMDMIDQFAKGTSEALTATAGGGTPAAPQTVVVTDTPQAGATGTPIPPVTPTNAIATTPVVVTVPAVSATPGGPTPIPGSRPATYTLQQGEFPYCIARRYNVDPNELLSINGLSNGDVYNPGQTLKIPQTGNPWPGNRALHTHPDTYTVSGSGDTTVYGVACYYGDIDPSAIASANSISVGATLTPGQKLTIP